MPNWMEGTLRIRGKKKDIIKFLNEAITPTRIPYDRVLYREDINYIRPTEARIEGLKKNYIESFADGIEIVEDDAFTYMRLFSAWDIDVTGLLELSQKYKLDFRISAYESGSWKHRVVEILYGEGIEENYCIEATTEADWIWGMDSPEMGG